MGLRTLFRKPVCNIPQQVLEEKKESVRNQTLIDLIASKGLKQADLAREIGKDRAYVCRIVNGKERPPREMMIKISDILGVDSRVLWPE